jgi:TRAP-type mannitol/chloroaromatic compound transport system permease large subunit
MTLIISLLPFLMFAAAFAALLRGFPVAFTLAGVGLAFALIGLALGLFDPFHLRAFPQRIYGNIMEMDKAILVAVPLFRLHGRDAGKVPHRRGAARRHGRAVRHAARRAWDLGRDRRRAAGRLHRHCRRHRGDDGIAVPADHAQARLFPALAAGSIAAAGTLGQIIPPSIVLVLLGDQLSLRLCRGAARAGHFLTRHRLGGRFVRRRADPRPAAGGVYVLYQIGTPSSAQARRPRSRLKSCTRTGANAAALIPPLILIIAVLGSILGGLATPTEAAGVGALGATLLAGFRNSRRQTPIPALGP